MRKFYLIVAAALLLVSCTQNKYTDDYFKNPDLIQYENPDCIDFAALWASGDIAEKLGKTKKWVFLNYTVDLVENPLKGENGNKTGKLRASSYAPILGIFEDYYFVESPFDQSKGWLHTSHVKAISRKNPKTRALCD